MLHCKKPSRAYVAASQAKPLVQSEITIMSKQLSISATISVLAMALFALSTAAGDLGDPAPYMTGAKATASTPVW